MNIEKVTKKYESVTGKFHSFEVICKNDTTVYTVPENIKNTDYQAIQEWAKIEGNNIIDPGA
jgi:hypothetical protein